MSFPPRYKPEEINDIRTRWRQGASLLDLAVEYGCTTHAIRKMVQRRSYKWVPDPDCPVTRNDWKRKLTEDDYRAIREAWWSGECSQLELARLYGVCQPGIHYVVHVPWPEDKWGPAERAGKKHHKPRSGVRPRPLSDLPEPESAMDIDAGTGRIIDQSTGLVYDSVGKAEMATGVDRLWIARQLLTPGSRWSYEPGPQSPANLAWDGMSTPIVPI